MSPHHNGTCQSLPHRSIATTAPLPVDDFLARFRNADPLARRGFLFALFPELTASERNELHNYHKTDIIGRLPLELAINIFSYLDVTASFRLQAVSKLWRDKLQSFAFFEEQRRKWYGCDHVPHQWALYPLNESWELRSKEAERIHRMCTGRPTEHLFLTELIHTTLEWSLKFCNDTLYWVPTPPGPGRPAEGRCVLSCNLYTGLLLEYVLPARERIHFVAISEELILMSAKKGCYCVTDLSDGKSKQFRLDDPGLLYENIQCLRRKVVISRTIERESIVWAYIWDFDRGRGQVFEIRIGDGFANTPQVGLPPLPIFMYEGPLPAESPQNPFDDMRRIVLFPVEPGTQNIAPGNPNTRVAAYNLSGEYLGSVRCSHDEPVCFRCFGSSCRSPPPKTSSMPIVPMPSNTNVPELSQACGNLRNVVYKPSFRLRNGVEHEGPCRFTSCLGTPTSPTRQEFPCISCASERVSHGLVRNRPLEAKWVRMCGDDNTIIMMWPSADNDFWTLEVFCFDKEKRIHKQNLGTANEVVMKRLKEEVMN